MLTSYASKVMQEILQNSLQQYVNWELPDVQTGFRKSRETREQIANIHWIIKKKKKKRGGVDFQNTPSSASLTMKSLWLCGSQKLVENSWGNGNTRPPYLPPEKLVCRSRNTVRTGHGAMDCFKIWKGVRLAVYCHCAYTTYMQSTWCKMPGWMNHRLHSNA